VDFSPRRSNELTAAAWCSDPPRRRVIAIVDN